MAEFTTEEVLGEIADAIYAARHADMPQTVKALRDAEKVAEAEASGVGSNKEEGPFDYDEYRADHARLQAREAAAMRKDYGKK